MKNLKTLLFILAIGITMLPLFSYAQGTMIWSNSYGVGQSGHSIFTNLNFEFGPGDYLESTNFLFLNRPLNVNDVGHVITIVSSAGDPSFNFIVNALTNGTDQSFDIRLGSADTARYESQLFGGIGSGPDLIGYQINSIDLLVDSLSFQSPGLDLFHDGMWTDAGGQVTLSIYGELVPEPSPSWLVLLGGGVLLYARRKT